MVNLLKSVITSKKFPYVFYALGIIFFSIGSRINDGADIANFLGASNIIIGVLWAIRNDLFYKQLDNELPAQGVYQKWSHEEPEPPYENWGGRKVYPEPEIFEEDFPNFTVYKYPSPGINSNDIFGVGFSHIQCNICNNWSVFPNEHIDGKIAYWSREMAKHLTNRHLNKSNISTIKYLLDLASKESSE